MTQNPITAWLQRKRHCGIKSAVLYAVVTLTGGAFVLGLTCYCFFVIAKLLLLSSLGLSPFVTAGSALVGIILTGFVFADAARARRDDMSFLPGWLLREYIGIGPRLILEGWPYVMRARRFARMDLEICTEVLTYLAKQGVPTSRHELSRHFPQVQWSNLSDDLRLLAGVIFFRPDNLRVILATPLRLELRALLARSEGTELPEPEPPAVPLEEPHKLSPAEILGLLPTASVAEIKIAYRRRIKECHPDRFANLDEHSRSLAEEWTKSLNAAYEILTTKAREQEQT